MIYDLKEHKMMPEMVFTTGTFGRISFERLAEMMKKNGELITGEKITHFVISERGIDFKTEIE